jgi:hypothetical protein
LCTARSFGCYKVYQKTPAIEGNTALPHPTRHGLAAFHHFLINFLLNICLLGGLYSLAYSKIPWMRDVHAILFPGMRYRARLRLGNYQARLNGRGGDGALVAVVSHLAEGNCCTSFLFFTFRP